MRQVQPADPRPPSLAGALAGTRVVELVHYTDTADLIVDTQSCHACNAPVEITGPHLRTIIRRPQGHGSTMFDRPVFCDQRCYTSWASGE